MALAGDADWSVAALAAEKDFTVVTNNRRDHLRRYAAMDVHNGLIVIVPAVDVTDQRRLFGLASGTAERQASLANVLIEVHADGTVEVRSWANDSPA